MLADPQVLTVNAVDKTMPRIETGNRRSLYQTSDELFSAEVSHQSTGKGRVRSLNKFTEKAVVTDPLSEENDYDNFYFQIVLDRPSAGFTITQIQQLWAAIKSHMDDAYIAKMFGQES